MSKTKSVKLTKLYGLLVMTLSKKHKSCNPLKNDKDSVENENNRKKKACDYDAKKKSQS